MVAQFGTWSVNEADKTLTCPSAGAMRTWLGGPTATEMWSGAMRSDRREGAPFSEQRLPACAAAGDRIGPLGQERHAADFAFSQLPRLAACLLPDFWGGGVRRGIRIGRRCGPATRAIPVEFICEQGSPAYSREGEDGRRRSQTLAASSRPRVACFPKATIPNSRSTAPRR
jgi:hypothetical protein